MNLIMNNLDIISQAILNVAVLGLALTLRDLGMIAWTGLKLAKRPTRALRKAS